MAAGATRSRVAVERATLDPAAGVRQALDGAAMRDLVRTDAVVFVKPNFTFPRPIAGVTTSHAVLEAVLGTLKDRASRVLVGEADGGYASFTAEQSFAGHGLPDICRRTGAEPVNLSKGEPARIEDTVLGKPVEVRLSRRVYGVADVGVSVPVMKTHAVHTFSLSLKNLWGCDADTMRLLRRKHLSRRLVLIARSLNMQLAVVDATTALDRYGPMEGDPVPLGLVLAADNLVAADAAGARLMGFDPTRFDIPGTAHRAGLGPLAAQDIDLQWDGPVPVRQFRLERRPKDYLAIMTFHSAWLSRTVYDSRLTPWIYRALGKTPRKRLT